MTKLSCEAIRDLLVDYADGQLSAFQSEQVEAHVGMCAACGGELDRLRRSLKLAQAVWRDAAEQAAIKGAASDRLTRAQPIPARKSPWLSRRWALVAASAGAAVVLLVALSPWMLPRAWWQRGAQDHTARKSATTEPVGLMQLSDEQIQQFIAREARSARLAAAAQELAGQPGLEQFQRQAEHYLVTAYGDTTAARQLSAPAAPKAPGDPES